MGALFPASMRSRALATHATAQFAGIVAGSWWGGWSADHIGWRFGFQIAALSGVAWAVILITSFRGVPDPIRTKPSLSKAPIVSPRFALFAASFFCLAMMLWVLYAWLPLSLVERFHMTMTESGLVASISLQSSAVVGVLTGGVLGDFIQQRKPTGRIWTSAIGLLISAPCFFLVFKLPTLGLTEAAAVIFGLFSGLFIANIFAVVFDLVDEGRHSSSAAVLNAVGGIAGGIGIFVSGTSAIGIESLAVVVGTLSMVIAVSVLVQSAAKRPVPST
jgi:MFS family permease